MNEPMEKRHHGLPDLQALDPSLSEETLALNSSSSSEFEDEHLNEKVDLITTTIGKSPPIIPLREERVTLGVECVFKAKGVGWSGVKKKRKKSKTSDSKEGCHQNICHKPLLQCFTNCSPVYDDDFTPKNSNTTKDRLLNAELKALSYPEYVDYLLRCRAKKKEYIEHPYLELEQSKDAEDVFKRRIFTRQLEARQETFDSAAISDYIVKGPVQQNEVRQNPSVSFDPLVRYYDINESDPSDTKIVYGAANDIDLLPSLQYNTKKSKTVSFADVAKKRPIYPPSQTEDDNNIDSNVGCCRYENILEESFMQSGKDNMSRDTMKCMGVSDTTIATTTYCAVDIEAFNARKRTKESESLHFSRGSSLMDSVNPKGSISQDGMIVPLSASSCIDMHHSDSHENRYECPDDNREQDSYHEERQSPSADACDSNIDTVDASDDDGIFSYITTPRENRFHFYFPDQRRFEESECINRQDTALQASFAKSDSDGTPLISNGVMKSSSMGSSSNFIQPHSVEHNIETPSRSNEASYDLKTTLDEAKICANTMQSTSALSDEDGMLATTLDNIAGIKSQTVSHVGCSASFTQETEVLTKKLPAVSASRKSDETNICDVSMQSSHKKNNSSFVSLSTFENNIDHRSKPCSSIGCSTSFEWNSRSSTSKSFDRRVLNDSGISERQQSPDLKQDSQAVLSPRADISIESGVKSSYDSGKVKVCDDVRQQSRALKQDSHVASAPRPATNIERKTQSKLCDDVSRQSPTLKQDGHVASVPRVNETIKHMARSCSSIGCSTSFEFDMHSSPEKTFTDGVTIKDPDSSRAATCFVEEQYSCVESENISASQMTAKPKHTAESNHKTFEIGVQTSISVSDLSLDGTRSRSPRKSPAYSIKRNIEASLDALLEDRNEETSQYPTMVDNRSPDSSTKSYKHGNNVSVQSTWGKDDGDLATLGSHVINKQSTPNHFFIKEDYDSINNDDNYEFTIPNSLSIDSCHSSLYSDEMSATYSSHKEYAGNPRNLPPLPRASEGRKGDKQDALSFTYTLPKSFSLSSYHSANTSLSKSSSMTHAEVEQCISYTLSELGRIHSMLDDANMDSMSCNSESTEGRDALYYARQSKNEIAALQNLIEQHINREKESNFNNRKLVKNGSIPKITGVGVAESSSFETMMSAKSRSSSIVENPSLDRLILDVSKLCTDIETRIENIVNDTNGSS